MKTDKERVEEFINKLSKLSEETGIVIDQFYECILLRPKLQEEVRKGFTYKYDLADYQFIDELANNFRWED